MHAAAQNLRGGVSPRFTRLRGQSIIEYVLIIAVIGLVIVFAGPGVAGAIRNQFSQVTNTVDSGTEGDNFISAEEKAYREAMKTVASKEAKDWTLDEQKAAATDIAKNGTSSVVYAKAKAAMDAGTKFTVKLTNGKTMEYRIIGINHDDLADGSGKAGLTFWVTNNAVGLARINSSNTNTGGWEKSELRAKMNSGEIWNLIPSDFQSKVKTVVKLSNNVKGAIVDAAVTPTDDRLFLLSFSEIVEQPYAWVSKYGWLGNEGTQYEAFMGLVTDGTTSSSCLKSPEGFQEYMTQRWQRTAHPFNSNMFMGIDSSGEPRSSLNPVSSSYVCPAFCF